MNKLNIEKRHKRLENFSQKIWVPKNKMDDLAIKRRSKSRMSSLFQRITWCGCYTDSPIVPGTYKRKSSSDLENPHFPYNSRNWKKSSNSEIISLNSNNNECLGRHFDLSSLRFIDEEDENEKFEDWRESRKILEYNKDVVNNFYNGT